MNISVLSDSPNIVWAIMGDCIYSMKEYFEKSGLRVFLTNNTFVEDSVNIIWGVGTHRSKDYEKYLQMSKSYNTIFVNMEQLGNDNALLDEGFYKLFQQVKYFDFNQANVNFLQSSINANQGLEFPFSPFKKKPSNSYNPVECAYDFAFFGVINDRRLNTIKKLEARGFTVKIIKGVYGSDLENEILDCKSILNIHHYTTSLFEVARCLRPVGIGIPVLSEKSNMPISIDWTMAGIDFFEYDSIADRAEYFLDNSNLIRLSNKSNLFASAERLDLYQDKILNFLK